MQHLLYLERTEMPSIEIDSQLFDWLAQQARPFESASDVIRRELAEAPPITQRNGSRPRRKHIASDLILPIDEYYLPILQVVLSRGGSARRRDVMDAVGEALASKFTPDDCAETKSGHLRWRSRTAWARQHLVWAGLLSDEDDRGIWTLTENGKKAAQDGEVPAHPRLRRRKTFRRTQP
jgi:hypothetical protein